MNKLFLFALSLLMSICVAQASESVTLSWTVTGVESTQDGVLANYPVLLGEDSDAGKWVLNSTEVSYAKTTSAVVTSGSTKVLQLGKSACSAVGTSLTLAADENPIPANATINSVKLLMKSFNTVSTWTVSVGETESDARTASSGTAMDAFIDLKFDDVNLVGNELNINFKTMETAKKYVYIAGISITYTPAEEEDPGTAAALDWTFAGVSATQSNVVFSDFPVTLAGGSAGGQWVLNSETASYAKTSTTWVTSGNAKTLQLGSSKYSPAGVTVSLSAVSNPIPANAVISAVELLVKSLNSKSVWSVSVNGVKAGVTQTAASATAMDNCVKLRFENLDMTGNQVGFAVESMETSGRYVFVAGVSVEYIAKGSDTPVERVEMPVFNPADGALLESGSAVMLTSATEGAVIHYAIGSGAFTDSADGIVTVEGAVGSTVTVQAYASKDGMADSDIAKATYIICAPAVVPPYSETFDDATAFNAWTTVDADADKSTWKYYSADNCAYIEHQIGNSGKNDWLISPALRLDASCTYTLRFDVRAGNAAYPEKIAVALGSEPTAAAMTTELLPATVVDYTDFRTVTCEVTPTASGSAYIGFHALSDGGMFRLFVDNIRLSAGMNSAAPSTVSDIVIINSPSGENSAEISFTVPSLTIAGKTLEAVSKVTVLRNGAEAKTFDNPAPGSCLSFIDAVDVPGEYTYTFIASNDAGEGTDVEVKAFVGINLPIAPSDAVFTETEPGKVLLSWIAPIKTVYGDAINPELVRYTIRDNNRNVLAENFEGTSWESTVVEAGEQALLGFSVYASTAAGINEADFASTDVRPVGTAYTLPYFESFEHWTASTLAEYITAEGGSGRWRIMRELIETGVQPYDADDGTMAFLPDFVGDKASYRTGRIAVPESAENPMLSFYLHNISNSRNVLSVSVVSADGEKSETVISPDWTGWKEQLVPLKEFAGKEVRICFTATAGTTVDATALDVIEVKEIEQHNLSLGRFRLPQEMDLLRKHLVTVEVVNTGLETALDYSVELYCDGDRLDSKRPGRISRNESVVVEFSVSPLRGEKAAYKAVVNYGADTDLSDNESEETETEIIKPLYSPATNLRTEVDGEKVLLEWDAPLESANTTQVTETFERYDEFKINSAGEWTFYDVDKGYTYGIYNGLHSFPNMGEQMAYIVFNGTIPTLDIIGTMTFGAHSGSQFLASFSVQGGETTNNDWLVSPLLNGSAQRVSFFIRSMSMGAHEKFEFLCSSTNKSIESFTKIGEGEDYSSKWTEFGFDVPEGTRYFAIRCVSHDQYAFFLDDITYIPAPTEIESIVGYDIYRDGDKLNEEPVAATSFTDAADAGEHLYQVYAVMPRGLAEPAEASVELSGVENIAAGYDGAVEVYNLQGVRIADSVKDLPSGIYIVREGAKTRKIRL